MGVVGPSVRITAGLVGGGLGSLRGGSDMFVLSMLASSGLESASLTAPTLSFSWALLRRAVGSVHAANMHKPNENRRVSAPNTVAKISFSRELSPAESRTKT